MIKKSASNRKMEANEKKAPYIDLDDEEENEDDELLLDEVTVDEEFDEDED